MANPSFLSLYCDIQYTTNPSVNKVFVAQNVEFFENDLIDLKASGSVEDLELIQEEDTNPSVDTSLNHEEDDQEIDEPQSDINPIRRSTRTRRLTARLHERHYEENFSPVADIRAIRILIAITAYYDYEIWQMDVKTAFLNGHLSEEVYMEQPEGFVNPKYPNHVCKLASPFMDLSKHQGNGISDLMMKSRKVVLFDWKSTYQVFLQTSSTYAEYIAAFDASKEAVMDSHSNAKGRDDGVTKGARDNFRAKFTIFAGTIRWDDVRIEKIDKHDIYGLNLSSFTPAGGWITNELINRHLESALDKTVKICQDNIHSDPGNGERTIEMTLLRVGPSIARYNAPFVFLGFGLLCAAFSAWKHERIRKEIEEREHEEEQDIINEVGKGAFKPIPEVGTTVFCSQENVTKQASMELAMHLVHEREQQLEVELSTKRHDGDTQEKRRLTRVL
ncbi:retrotransposon protein, putative, ty1-copia subclass [Tanacetum coccineum]